MNNLLDNLLPESLDLAKLQLQLFADNPDFSNKIKIAFGENADVTDFQNAWLTSDFSTLPKIEIRSTSEINNANGAFSSDTNTIYLSQEYLLINEQNPEIITEVLLEEIGHFVDSQINAVDAPGDEGEIFAAEVVGTKLSEDFLRLLKQENDTTSIILDGIPNILVEQNGSSVLGIGGSAGISGSFIGNDTYDISISLDDSIKAGALIDANCVTDTGWLGIAYAIYDANGIPITSSYSTIYSNTPSNQPEFYLGAGQRLWIATSAYVDGYANDDFTLSLTALPPYVDLSVNIYSLDPFLSPNLGQEFVYTIYYNAASFYYYDSNYFELTHTVPDGLKIIDVISGNPNFSLNFSGNNISLNGGPLATSEYNTYINITVIPEIIGEFDLQAEITTTDNEVNPQDNIFNTKINVIDDKVDLELTKVDSPDPVNLGDNLTYTLTVFNNSDNDATEVNLTETLPQGVNFISSSLTPVSNTNNILTFDLGTLAAKATQTVDVIVTPTQVGQITNTASVGSKEIDSDPNDNTTQETTEVKADSFYKFSSWKYDTNGSGIQTVVDKTIYAEFPAGVIPNPNGVYKGGYIVDSLIPLSKSQVANPSEIINEDISNQFLNVNEIYNSLRIEDVNPEPNVKELNFSSTYNVPLADIAKLLNYNHFNWLQGIGPEVSNIVDIYSGWVQPDPSNSNLLITTRGAGIPLVLNGQVVTNKKRFLDPASYGYTIHYLQDNPDNDYLTSSEKDSLGFYYHVPGYGGDNDYGYRFFDQIKSPSPDFGQTVLHFEDRPTIRHASGGDFTQFFTELVGVKDDLKYANSIPILPVKRWTSNFQGFIISGGGFQNNTPTAEKVLGEIQTLDDSTTDEFSQEEKQFLEENGVDVTPPNVNLSVVRTNNSGAIDIGQDYTYTFYLFWNAIWCNKRYLQ